MSSIDRGSVLQQLDRLFSEGTLASLGDGELLERFLTRRDNAAFETLVEVHGPMVLGLCRRFLRDPRDIEDAFQATFLVLLRKAPGIRDGSLLSNWLYGVALRVATRARANLLRRRGREQAIGDAEFPAMPEFHDILGIGPVLDQELSRLPAKYRAPLVLCYLRGQTHDQAATELKCPVGTVRSRMARGRDLLKRRLTRRGLAPSASLFGAGHGVQTHLLTEAVPPQLVASTVQAAFALGSSHTAGSGAAAASVLALTQGVVTSMKIAQLKWIGLALLATGLSAGGAAVVAAVSAQNTATTQPVISVAAVSADPFQEAATGSVSASSSSSAQSKSTEARLRVLEDEIDRISQLSGAVGHGERSAFNSALPADSTTLDRLEAKLHFLLSRHDPRSTTSSARSVPKTGSTSTSTSTSGEVLGNVGTATTTPATTIGKGRSSSSSPDRKTEPRSSPEGSSAQIRELEAQLNLAAVPLKNTRQLRQQNVVSQGELEHVLRQFELPLARLRGMAEDFDTDLERARLVVKRKNAELDEATGQAESAGVIVTRNARLNAKKPGMVSEEDATRAEADQRAADAHVRVKSVDLEEAELECRKLERWRESIRQIIESSSKLR